MQRIIGPFKQILTMVGIPLKGSLRDAQLDILEDACVLLENERIAATGCLESLVAEFPAAIVEELPGNHVLLPGFIDSHTHLCWAGSRANDFAMRLEGKTYLEIAESGGGIWSTVQHTRSAHREQLVTDMLQRIEHQVKSGITTIEIKSGYGLNKDDEIKMLRSIKSATRGCSATLIPTCLAAHMKPKNHKASEREYLQFLINEVLPYLKEHSLTKRVDIFIERSAFNQEDALFYLSQAKRMGFSITIHGDQFTVGGSEIAIRSGAVSVDHLEASTDVEIEALANSSVIATVLPGASMGLGMNFAPARKMLDAGCSLSIASDWNPGSAPMGELLMQASVMAVYEKLSIAEVLAGLTIRAAAALELSDRGSVVTGHRADLQAYNVSDYRDIIYNQGRIRPEFVWTGGVLME
ncbi:MAG: imidazolonepropionase [Bacteroidetes bacterium]|nr:imidazolonepropionase [Bacteroidota bacterium]